MAALNITKNKPLKELSTIGIGGYAEYFCSVSSLEELQFIHSYARKNDFPITLIGKGSNSLFPDQGIQGIVVQNRIDFCKISENRVEVGSGYFLPLLVRKTVKASLAGLEFALSIPSTVGGAIWMNAGASQSEIKDVLDSVTFLHKTGGIQKYKKEDLTFSYRHSSFQKMDGVIVSAEFSLASQENVREKMLFLAAKRKKSQPLSEKTIGSIFKNPENHSAGALIEFCGLKGKRVGDAMVSSLHANFIVNTKNATQKEVLELIDYIKEVVQKKTGILLKEEIRIFS